MRARLLGVCVVVAVLSGAASAQAGKPKPVEPVKLPADWQQRDLEGKWLAFRRAMGRSGDDPRSKEAWTKALGAARETDLLEWIAVYEGWRLAGPELARLDAPQLMRAAVWNLGSLDSHDLESAEKAMRARPALAVGWFEAHPVAQRGKAAAIYTELRDQIEGADASRYLPPHDPMQVLVPWLDAPAELAEFGARLTAEPRVRYVHQVLRALDGVTTFGRPDRSIVRKVLRLGRHDNQAVHRAAFRVLSKLPAELVPHAELTVLAHDAELQAGLRHLATTTLSYSSHPLAFFEVQAIAVQADHPGRIAAIVRLGEIGDETTLAALGGFALEQNFEVITAIQQATARIGQRKRLFEFVQVPKLRMLLHRVAWLHATEDPRAKEHEEAGKRLLAAQDRQKLAAALDALLAAPAASAPFGPDVAERVDQEYRRLLTELRK